MTKNMLKLRKEDSNDKDRSMSVVVKTGRQLSIKPKGVGENNLINQLDNVSEGSHYSEEIHDELSEDAQSTTR